MDAVPVPDRDWSGLPPDVLSLIFAKTGAIEVLMGAGLVCHPWLDAAKAADMWRTIDMERHGAVVNKQDKGVLRAMAKVAVDRSDGRLEAFAAKGFVNDELLMYLRKRSPSLKSLRLVSCRGVSKDGFTGAMIRAPPPHLRSLQLVDMVNLTTEELITAVDACPRLETLLVHYSFNIGSEAALRVKCAAIKNLKVELEYHGDPYFGGAGPEAYDWDLEDWGGLL
uniref:F-box domain-containing protein n=1 Tax=Hordeum vulgare subsp. vulgare TaxID=112509 RepID=A0A8I6WHR1_HORVV